MKLISKYILLFFCSINFTVFAQEGKLNRAKKNYDNLAYIKASDIYLKVAESGFKSDELFQRLANTYYFNANYQEAAKWYKELFALSKNIDPIYYLRYSQSLKSSNKIEEAKQYYDQFLERINAKEKNLKSTEDYLDMIKKNSGRYKLNPININSSGVDFGISVLNKEALVFASTRDTGMVSKRIHKWNNLPFMDLYQAKINQDGTLQAPEKLKGDVNTKHHETTATFTKDGKTMYFTRNNTTARTKTKMQRLKIYRATLVDDEWTNIEDLSINSDTYSTAHPCLSSDDSKLYFVSDMPGSEGLTDIFIAPIDAKGALGNIKNLGSHINTKGRESFPFITKSNELYFSSDGHFGLGGYDVFYVDLNDEEAQLLNVGEPINSTFDDITFYINSKKKGFISSNRNDGMGYDDIYSFVETIPIKSLVEATIFGKVTNKSTNMPLTNASVTLLDSNNKSEITVTTDVYGNYKTTAKRNTSYLVRADKDTYNSDESYLETKLKENELNFELAQNEFQVTKGDDVSKALSIDNIYFDLDKSNIRRDAEVELQKVITLLKFDTNLKIEVRAHTDSRANDAYNLRLSNARAKVTVDYIVRYGIDKSRVSGKGYGETQLVNNCTNGSNCTEMKHQENRRSEFIVTQL